MKIIPIYAFEDNYIWLIEEEGKVAIVDPGEAEPVLAYLDENRLNLDVILLTHNHWDHVDGVAELEDAYPQVKIYGPIEVKERVSQVVKEGDHFNLFGHPVKVFKTAGHTKEHISYLLNQNLFSGDALFAAGCGRVFTGDYQAQYDAIQKFKALDNQVKVYCGHEYTLTNLSFAHSQFLDNQDIKEALLLVKGLRQEGKITLPTTIGQERKTNPFFFAKDLDEFIKLRQARDNFKK